MTDNVFPEPKVAIRHSQELYRGKSFTFISQQITLPNGADTETAFVRHPGSSAIVPVYDDRKVVMIRQYRHAVGGFMLEIPAGSIEVTESPLACARRELEEEAGLTAESFKSLGHIHLLPSYSDERAHLYLARGLRPSRQHLDEDEIIQVVTYPFGQAMQMMSQGKITGALTVIALQRVHAYFDGKKAGGYRAAMKRRKNDN